MTRLAIAAAVLATTHLAFYAAGISHGARYRQHHTRHTSSQPCTRPPHVASNTRPGPHGRRPHTPSTF